MSAAWDALTYPLTQQEIRRCRAYGRQVEALAHIGYEVEDETGTNAEAIQFAKRLVFLRYLITKGKLDG